MNLISIQKLLMACGICTFSFFAEIAQAQTEPRLDSFFQTISVPDQPGFASLVIKDGSVVHQKGYGISNMPQMKAINPETVFQLASTSKQFTAFAIFLLAQQKKLKLSDSIRSILKDLPKYTQAATIQDVIYHISGLPDYYLESDLCFRDQEATNDDVIKFLKTKKALHFAPGKRFEYSNTGYVLLAQIIKKISGLSYNDFLQENIFKPLSMSYSFAADSSEKLNLLQTESYYSENLINKPFAKTSCEQIVGDGGVHSNLLDMQKWLLNIQMGTLTSVENINNVILKPGRLKNGKSTNYAFGWFIDKYSEDQVMVHHGGGWLGYHHSLVYLPNQKIWSLILSNHLDYGPPARDNISNEILDLMLNPLKN